MPLTTGARLGSYEILSPIGSGGMGEVYRARDPKLNRFVAIKVLSEQTTADPERRMRFEHEARTIAALTHPNIVTIHSAEEDNGVLFLTMEYVEGKPLTDLIVKGGAPLTQILALAIPLADALSAAHQKGITHRDVKPANVMVTADGRVKVLDFGLAKLIEPSPTQPNVSALPTVAQTGEGRILGTVAYMSPEQAEGKPVDPRSDIFSLGTLLYELATGDRPFTGDSSVSVISAILKDTPRSVTEVNPTLPAQLSRIVTRCLVKDPVGRYQSGIDLRHDLEELQQAHESGTLDSPHEAHPDEKITPRWIRRHQTGVVASACAVALVVLATIAGRLWFPRASAGVPIDSIAVLPFVNGSGSADAEYLSDGLADTLTNNLAQIRTLRVVPRTLSARYKNQIADPRQAGRELNVRAVVTGRVTQRGDQLLVQVELIDVGTVAQLWGERFDRRVADALSIQADLSRAIADNLRLRLTPEDERGLAAGGGTRDEEAYQLYLKGQFELARGNRDGLTRAISYFEQAVARDTAYSLAYSGTAQAYYSLGFYGYLSAGEAYPKAMDMARKAIGLDDRSSEAHSVLGHCLLGEWRWEQSEREHQRALTLDPNNAAAHIRYSASLQPRGRHEEAIAEARRAVALDPLSPTKHAGLGAALMHARRYDEAAEADKQAIELDADFVPGHLYLARTYWLSKRIDLAVAESQRLGTFGQFGLAMSAAAAGRKPEAIKLLKPVIEQARRSHTSVYVVAAAFAIIG
jgi:serine/threonine-protein kinase